MKFLYRLSAVVVFLFAAQLATSQNNTIKLRSGDLEGKPTDQKTLLSQFVMDNPSAGNYYLMQFNQIPTAAEQAELKASGINLLEYIPHKSWIAKINAIDPSLSFENQNIRFLEAWKSKYKTAANFDLSGAPKWVYASNQKVKLMVSRQLDVDQSAFISLMKANGVKVEDEINKETHEYVLITMNESKLEWLKNLAEVKFIDYGEPPVEPDDIRARGLHRLNLLGAGNPFRSDLNGDSVDIAIADNGLGSHIDRKGRVTMYTTTNNGTHGDMTAGIAVGAGNLNPRYKGHATHSHLHYYNISGYPQINQAVNNFNFRNVVITSTSFSQGCNSYNGFSRAIDQQVNGTPELLHVFSAGNNANANCGYGAGTLWGTITGGYKQGKSVIATGNLDYRGNLTFSSSRGPAADGRIKPDICANGTSQISTDPNNRYSPGGGTSAAAPSIAGIAAVMYQGYKKLHNNQNPPSGLIKSAMLNTARDIGDKGPDFWYGWGVVNAHRAMLLLEENRYTDSAISQGNLITHDVVINQTLPSLKLMVYWTDAASSTASSKALINDLDLRVVTPNNDTLLPYVLNPTANASTLGNPATNGVDDLNNVEQVEVDSAIAGTYRILVNGTAIPNGPQEYFLLWETIEDSITVTYPAGGEPLVPFQRETIRWDAPENQSGSFTVEYSSNGGASWSTIATPGSTVRHLDITVPNTVTGNALFRVSRNGKSGVSPQGVSIIRQPSNVRAEFVCPDSTAIAWDAVSGATSYDIFVLGATHMDSVGSTTTTQFTINNLDFRQENWVAVRARGNGIVGERSNAIELPQNTFDCILAEDLSIKSFVSPERYSPNCSPSLSKQAVTISVKNYSDTTLSNVPLRLRINSNLYFDTLSGPIASLATQNFTFSDSVSVSASSSTNISAIVDLSGDQNEFNDSIARDVTLIPSVIFTVPYSMNFESFSTCPTTFNCGVTVCSLSNGWTNISNSVDDVDMRVDLGGTPSNNTGPFFDANPGTSTGKYLYTEASNDCFGRVAELLTPCFDLNGTFNPRFEFAYHMYGSNVGSLAVDIFANGEWNNNVFTPLTGNFGNVWNRRSFNLSAYAGDTITIRFRITTGPGFSSDIAIDDFSLTDQSVGLNESSTSGQYTLFPNPSEGLFRINLMEEQIGEVRVFDLQGRNIYRTQINANYGEIDLSAFDKGIYIIEFKNGQIREKVMIN